MPSRILFAIGECIFIRMPEEIWIEAYVERSDRRWNGPPTISTGSGSQDFAFIRQVRLRLNRSFALEVYPVLSFTSTGGALPTFHRMKDAAAQAALLPLSPLLSQHPTPAAFGEQLDFGNWSTYEDSFLHVFPRRLIVGSFFLMPIDVLFRIDSYREYLLSTTAFQGSSNPPHGQNGEFSVKSTHGLLALEDVDEDAEDADATTQDEVILLARDNLEELRRYLQEEK